MSSTDFFQNFWSGNWLQIVPSAWRFGAQKNVVRAPFPIASTFSDANSIDNITSMGRPSAGPRSSRSGARPSRLSTRPSLPSIRPSQSSGRKRSPSPESERPQKKSKLSKTPEGKASEQLLKRDGVQTATGRIVNPEGVIAGRFPSYFPTTQSDESKGFRNVSGSQCYRSSLLQALLHVPAVYHLLGNIHRDCDKRLTRCVICALQDLAQRYWNSGSNSISYSTLDGAMRVYIPKSPKMGDKAHSLVSLHTNDQDDPVPYLRELLEQLCVGPDASSVDEVFNMDVKRVWTCVDCGEISDSSEDPSMTDISYSYLLLPINVPASGFTLAEYLLSNFFRNENIQPRCESIPCQVARVDKGDDSLDSLPFQTQELHITKAPRVLVIQLQRFVQSVGDDGMIMFDERGLIVEEKYKEPVEYEEYLNLGRYTESGHDLIYRLDATIAHRGLSTRSGHYIAAVRAKNGYDFETINDNSIEFDSNVSGLEVPSSFESYFDSYVLVYSLCSSPKL